MIRVSKIGLFQYLVQVPTWKHLCSLSDDLSEIENVEHLERLLQQHFNLSENISRIYAQVNESLIRFRINGFDVEYLKICNDGKAIIDSVAPSQQTTSEYQFDFRAGAKHILEIVQEVMFKSRASNFRSISFFLRCSAQILVNHRYLDTKWNQRKAFLQQRLSFVAFANDVQQVRSENFAFVRFENESRFSFLFRFSIG